MPLYIDEGYNGWSQTDEDVLLIADSLARVKHQGTIRDFNSIAMFGYDNHGL